MWIKRDFFDFLKGMPLESVHPVKVLKGPRQVGKTSLLERIVDYRLIQLDDLNTRQRAQSDPRSFLDEFKSLPIILDEATLAPELFPELKRRVDEFRRLQKKGDGAIRPDIWITGSNQTLLERAVQESLAGRASYFDLNTLSIHELGKRKIADYFLKGGWPELYSNSQLATDRYLNDLISTFIEKDIVSAAGIERKAAFSKMTGLIASRIGQLVNASDLAKNVGVETTTVQSWIAKLQENAVVRVLPPFYNNLNQRLIKTPKIYFEDVGLASRLQGWVDFIPLSESSSFGHLVENLGVAQFSRYFSDRGQKPALYFLRSKEKVEVDLLIQLPNNRWLAVEIKTTSTDFTASQLRLLQSTGLNIIDKWVVGLNAAKRGALKTAKYISFFEIHRELEKLHKK
jgi:uncharacterized protein